MTQYPIVGHVTQGYVPPRSPGRENGWGQPGMEERPTGKAQASEEGGESWRVTRSITDSHTLLGRGTVQRNDTESKQAHPFLFLLHVRIRKIFEALRG